VGLAEAGAAVQQQRVVRSLAGLLRGMPGGGSGQLVAAALDEVVEGVMAVQVAAEGLGGGRGDRARPGGRRRGRGHDRVRATQRADVQRDLCAAEMRGEFANPRQVAAVDFVADEGVGGVEHQGVVAAVGLQRLQPGQDILGRQFGFEVTQAGRPDIHGRGGLGERRRRRRRSVGACG
jgi:hypothetical protein